MNMIKFLFLLFDQKEKKVLDLTTAVAMTLGTTILPTQVNHVCLPLLYVYRTPTSVDYFHSHTLLLSSVPLHTLNILNVLEGDLFSFFILFCFNLHAHRMNEICGNF